MSAVFSLNAKSVGFPKRRVSGAALRGPVSKDGVSAPNDHFEDSRRLISMQRECSLMNPACVIDTNHSNSNKECFEQIRIADESESIRDAVKHGGTRIMKAVQLLPEGYRKILRISLMSDRRIALRLAYSCVAAFIAVLVLVDLMVPGTWFSGMGLLQFLVLAATYVGYIVLHELTHALAMKAVGGGKVVFGFRGYCAYAGSNGDWFDRTAYRCIALAPLTVFGLLFFFLSLAVPAEWFRTVWILQALNISGSVGDVYVTARLWRMPETILVKDTGTEMTVYDRPPET